MHRSALSRPSQIRADSDARCKRRRTLGTQPRAKTSVSTTVAVNGDIRSGSAVCAIFCPEIALHSFSSTNIVVHFKPYHKKPLRAVRSSDAVDEKRSIIERAVMTESRSQSSMRQFARGTSRKRTSHSVSRDLVGNYVVFSSRCQTTVFRFTGKCWIWSGNSCLRDTARKSKSVYVRLLREVYETITKLSTLTTGNIRVGSETYDGWSSKMGCPIAGMTWHFIDQEWCLKSFPLCSFNIQDMGKSTAYTLFYG